MCIECINDYRVNVDGIKTEEKCDPLHPTARSVLDLMCIGEVEYSHIVRMLSIYFSEYPGAFEQLAGDVMNMHRIRAAKTKQAPDNLATFTPRVAH